MYEVITDLSQYDALDAQPSLLELLDRKRYWMQLACLWRHLEDTVGLKPQDVRTFGFNPVYLSDQQQIYNAEAEAAGKNPIYSQANWHNCVRLRNYDIVPMPIFPRPLPPASMAVSVEEVDE
jgi:hypothetical protein